MRILIYTFLLVGFFGCSSSNQLEDLSKEERKALIHYDYGTQLLMDKNYPEALKHLRSAFQIRPKDSKILNHLGMAYYFSGSVSEGLSYIMRSLEVDPKNSFARNNLASIYFEQGQMEKAKAEYRKVIQDLEYKNKFETFFNLGLIGLKQNQPNLAMDFFKKSVEANPTYCPAHVQIGWHFYQNQKFKLALKSFREATSGTCFETPAGHYFLGKTYLQLGQKNRALETFDILAEKYGDQYYGQRAEAEARRLRPKVSGVSTQTLPDPKNYGTDKVLQKKFKETVSNDRK